MSPIARPPIERLRIDGPAGPLEAVVEDPRGTPTRCAVVCHPHPLHGGTLDNKVVHTLARTLQELGIPTVRFNFRGVGKSAGKFEDGPGETEDLLAVVAWARARWPGTELWLAGFSFGGYVALLAAPRAGAARLITVAPAIVRRFESAAAIPMPDCPWLIVQGDADDLVDVNAIRERAAGLDPAPTLTVLSGVDHYFHGHL
ncbi:MAG: alpha/beta fold hydrolase, partial [Steroidobacteraceae bacterium]